MISFLDALIVEAALAGGADRLLTEDLQHGQEIQGLRVENPFHLILHGLSGLGHSASKSQRACATATSSKYLSTSSTETTSPYFASMS